MVVRPGSYPLAAPDYYKSLLTSTTQGGYHGMAH